MPIVELPFGTISFRERGEGVPIILVMGTGADHTSWARQIPALSRRLRVIAPDNRGSGRSVPSPGPGATTISFAAECVAFADALGLATFHIAGYSLGAAIAMEVALLVPDRILAASFHAGWAGPNPATTTALERSLLVAATGGAQAFFEAACRRNMSPAFQQSPGFPAFLKNVLHSAAPPAPEGIIAQTRAGLRHDARARLPALRARALVTTGEHDPVAPPRVAEEIASLIPDAQIHIFRGERAWHAIPLEMADELNEVLLAFHG